jgi:hypothetical protein
MERLPEMKKMQADLMVQAKESESRLSDECESVVCYRVTMSWRCRLINFALYLLFADSVMSLS